MPSTKPSKKITLPALRGGFGSWIYYSCLMPIREIGARVDYATELHPAEAHELSKFIQRALEGRRATEIADYLTKNADRFFNSLVLAVYGGHPDWLEIGISGTSTPRASLDDLTQEVRDSIGFLRLAGKEKIFAIDGQHRLSGIKRAMTDNNSLLADELVPVIFVGHTNTATGMRRSRRLFTTLNKTAVAVTKRDIIALDEDDVMAITVRELYEHDKRFSDPRIAIIATNNLPPTSAALTTIGNLYDVLKLLFMHHRGGKSDATLRFNRPSDQRLKSHHEIAKGYFEKLSEFFPPLAKYYRARDPSVVAREYRSASGGHLLFRPIGLELVTRAVIAVAEHRGIDLPRAIHIVSKIEIDIAKGPYAGVIWNSTRGTVISRGKTLARRLMLYMLRVPSKNEETLLKDYRVFLGLDESDTSVTLPRRVK